MEQKHGQSERNHNNGYNYDLRGVIESDFIPTLVFLREIYFGERFRPSEFVGFFDGLKWLMNSDNFLIFKTSPDGSDLLPKPVRDFQHTLRLFIDLKHEIENGKDNVFLGVPVAYSSRGGREKLIRDLEHTTYESWDKFRNDPDFKSPDALTAKLFHSYWVRLKLRAILVKSAREPSGN